VAGCLAVCDRTASKSAEGVKPTDCKKSTRAVEFWICVSTWLGLGLA
jgi:hypothetical protein